jgi:RNA polymerase sigma-70 factor (ECF subfamily)
MHDKDRSHEQFVELLSESSKRIYSYVRTLVLNDENEAEEIFQSTCVAAWTKFEGFEEGSSFGAWACQIAYYEVLRLRASRRRIRFFSEEVLAQLADAAMPIAERVHERRDALAECINKLQSDDLKMIDARYFQSQLPKQIARIAGESVDSVYRRLRRINRQLLQCVQRTLGGQVVR